MNPGDLEFLKATLYDNGGPGLEKPQNWFSKEEGDLCLALRARAQPLR